jgi:hypothetical protein
MMNIVVRHVDERCNKRMKRNTMSSYVLVVTIDQTTNNTIEPELARQIDKFDDLLR